jgi:hypothetical protein
VVYATLQLTIGLAFVIDTALFRPIFGSGRASGADSGPGPSVSARCCLFGTLFSYCCFFKLAPGVSFGLV